MVDAYLHVLNAERGASAHTVRAYRRELHDFAAWLHGHHPRLTVIRIEHTHIRSYLGTLYDRGLSKASAARALASIRSWFKWLARAHHIEQNAASLVSTPRLPKHLPRVPSIEQLNRVVDTVLDDASSWPARDKAILEMLYGCGIRNAELTTLDLDDIHWANEAILVRGKGQKQRYVPLGDTAAEALRAYIVERSARLAAGDEQKESKAAGRVSGTRPRSFSICSCVASQKVVRPASPPAASAASSSASPSCAGFPPTFTRTLCAMPSELICSKKAPTFAPFRSCSATSASQPLSATPSSPPRN